MNDSMSFLELRLEAGELLVVLGSGHCDDVFDRAMSQPYLRVCMRDPEVVDYRVRCGTAELTDNGLDYSSWNEFQNRGASLRRFAWSTSIVRTLGGDSEIVRDLIREGASNWFEFKDGELSKIDEQLARSALSSNCPSEAPRMLIQFQVPPERTDEMLALLRKNHDSAVETEESLRDPGLGDPDGAGVSRP